MYQISRRDKRQRTGFEYAPDAHAPSLLNKSQYVMMNGKISSRSQYMGLNFKDDSRDTTYVNIAEAGYAFDAVSRSDVVSTAPVNVAAAGRAVINMRQLLTFLSMLFEVDPTLKDLLERYRARFKQQYEVLEPMATVDANPKVTPKTGSMAMAATTTQTGSMPVAESSGSMPVAESSGQFLGNIAGNMTRKYLEIRTISKAYLTVVQSQLADGAISQKQAQEDEEDLNKAVDRIKYLMDSDILVGDKLKHLDFLKNALIKDLEARKTAFAGRSSVIPPEPSSSIVTPEATLPPGTPEATLPPGTPEPSLTPEPAALTAETTVSEVIAGKQKNPKPAKGEDGQYDFVTLAKEGRLNDLTTREMKVYLQANSLKMSGNKAAVMARIQAHVEGNSATPSTTPSTTPSPSKSSTPMKIFTALRKSFSPSSPAKSTQDETEFQKSSRTLKELLEPEK